MTYNVLVKVYGHVWPANEALALALKELMPYSEHLELDEIISLEGDLVRISFEGIYFPLEEVVHTLKKHLQADSQGKLDYIDLEDWSLCRHNIQGVDITIKTSPLNNVLDYSNH